MKLGMIFLLFLFLNAYALIPVTLEKVSSDVNKNLPEVYDPITKLVSTSVEHHHFKYHFIVDATEKEFQEALPKVKAQVLKTICQNSVSRSVLTEHKATIVYSYENVKGQTLGQFLVKPPHCRK